MSKPDNIPERLEDGSYLPESTGGFDGEWFSEEHVGATRLGLRGRKLHEETSPYQKISVYESAFFGNFLTLDDVMMLTERDEFVYHELLVHVPLCSMKAPRRVLIIGGGDCGCLREVLRHPEIEHVVQCDIDERVTRVCEQYFPWASEAVNDPRAEILFDDGVRYIEETDDRFDLVVVDSTDPKGPALALFLRSFYSKVGSILSEGGVMTAQTESPFWDASTVCAVYGELGAAFGHVRPFLAWIPTYPSGCWSLAFASNSPEPHGYLDEARANRISSTTRYYNSEIHRTSFALPNFVRHATEGIDDFAGFAERQRRLLGAS